MRGPNATPPPELVEELRRVRASADTTTPNSTTATRGDGTNMSTDQQLSEPEQASRTRRAEPITQHIAKNGTVSYWFQADVGTKPDGSRDRRRFTYRTKAEARREFRRITSEVAAGIYNRPTAITVDDACDQWLDGRRGIRRVTLEGYRHDLKPVAATSAVRDSSRSSRPTATPSLN